MYTHLVVATRPQGGFAAYKGTFDHEGKVPIYGSLFHGSNKQTVIKAACRWRNDMWDVHVYVQDDAPKAQEVVEYVRARTEGRIIEGGYDIDIEALKYTLPATQVLR